MWLAAPIWSWDTFYTAGANLLPTEKRSFATQEIVVLTAGWEKKIISKHCDCKHLSLSSKLCGWVPRYGPAKHFIPPELPSFRRKKEFLRPRKSSSSRLGGQKIISNHCDRKDSSLSSKLCGGVPRYVPGEHFIPTEPPSFRRKKKVLRPRKSSTSRSGEKISRRAPIVRDQNVWNSLYVGEDRI